MNPQKNLNVIISGSRGRMGTIIARLVKESEGLVLAGEAEKDLPLESVIDKGDVVIDFTVHDAAARNVAIAAHHGRPMVIGTTGLSKDEESIIKKASTSIPIVYSSNMSIGVNVMWKIVETAARVLAPKFKVDIVETHHTKKLDRPSGTAKKILDIVLAQGGWKMDRDVFFYEEKCAEPAAAGPVSVCSFRKGEVVGDHTIHFTSSGESIEITHHAFNREVFAQGALVAAKWIVGKPPGLYGMADVLNI